MARKANDRPGARMEIRLPLPLKVRLTGQAMLDGLDRSELAARLIEQGLNRYRSDRARLADPARREEAA
jgi:hypothetical protein